MLDFDNDGIFNVPLMLGSEGDEWEKWNLFLTLLFKMIYIFLLNVLSCDSLSSQVFRLFFIFLPSPKSEKP